jgi:hypothetical protein
MSREGVKGGIWADSGSRARADPRTADPDSRR